MLRYKSVAKEETLAQGIGKEEKKWYVNNDLQLTERFIICELHSNIIVSIFLLTNWVLMGLDERSTNQISGIQVSLKISAEPGGGKCSHCEVGSDGAFILWLWKGEACTSQSLDLEQLLFYSWSHTLASRTADQTPPGTWQRKCMSGVWWSILWLPRQRKEPRPKKVGVWLTSPHDGDSLSTSITRSHMGCHQDQQLRALKWQNFS